MAFKNYYQILGVKNTASFEEIKLAYRKLAKKYHPDTNQENKELEDYFKEIQEAYAVLSTVDARIKYDQKFSYSLRYSTSYKKQHVNYAGDAYRYAQQYTHHKNQYQKEQKEAQPVIKEKKTDADPYLFLISIVVAILLLFFIMAIS